MSTVTLYGRPGCHLCEDARATLERLRSREPFAVEDVDIESDPALHARYLERIPVIAVDGEELSELFVDEEALLARLRREGGPAQRGSIVSPR
jgi:glutaredoxin